MHLFGRLRKGSPKRSIASIAPTRQQAGKMTSESIAYEYYQIKARYPDADSNPNDGINRWVFVRQDIDEWSGKKSNKKQVDLFILALDKFQKLDPKGRLSYFQIAGMCLLDIYQPPRLTSIAIGIHGQPFVRWDDPSPEPMNSGYCFHSHVIFPIWHRPYVLLFEVSELWPLYVTRHLRLN
jgi:tyrosinase